MAGSQRLLHRHGAGVTPAPVSARAVRGRLALKAEADERGQTVLTERIHQGAFHLSKPYWDGNVLMVQWINPTAGIFAGDVLESRVRVGSGASLLVTTPSATRIHTRTSPDQPAGQQHQHFQVAAGGWLEVQPEWLIPQRGSAFSQSTHIEVEQGGALFYAELLAPGRFAHGESLVFARLALRTRLSVGGQVIAQERLLAGAPDRLWMLASREGTPMFSATLWLVLPEVGRQAAGIVRECLTAAAECESGVAVLPNGVLGIRLLAARGMAIRSVMASLRARLAKSCKALRTSMRKL